MNITWIGSPNFDTNRTTIDRIVIHWFGVGASIKGVDIQFQKENGTSAHYAVEDTTVHQYVKEDHVAYHAGNYSVNQRSIGIEHSAEVGRPATELTYATSSRLIADICKRYSIPIDRLHIIGHKEIKATQCPGTIDIDKLINLAKAINSTSTMTDQQAQDYVKAIQKKYSVFYKAEDVLKYIDDRANEIRGLQDESGSKSKEITALKKAVEVAQNLGEHQLAQAKIDCQRKVDDVIDKNRIDMENIETRYKEEIKKLKEDGVVVEVPIETSLKKRFTGKGAAEKLAAIVEIIGA